MVANQDVGLSTNLALPLPPKALMDDGKSNDSIILSQLKSLSHREPVTYDLCIHQMIQDRAHRQPEAPAIDAWDGKFTYAQLDALSTAFAARLRHHGVAPEVFVPIYAERSRWVPVAMLAVLKAGGAFALLEIAHPVARLKSMCQTLGATRVIASRRTAEIASQLTPDVFLTDDNYSDQPAVPAVDVSPSNLAYAVFTSGSTGNPKAVAIEHGPFCSSAMAHGPAANVTAEVRALQFASYAFDACILETLTPLILGGCVCIPSEEGRTSDLAGEVLRLQPNWAVLTPSVARIIDVADFSMLKTLALAGEAMNGLDVLKWAPHVDLFVAYGVSEASVCNLVRRCSSDDVDHTNLGYGTGVQCWLVDPDDHDQLVPVGAEGELLLDGPAVGRGYIGDPARTAEAFIDPPSWYSRLKPDATPKRNKLYKTGDLCTLDPTDGSVRYIGRKDHQRKFHGQRLELGEVEHNLQRLLPHARNIVVEIVKIDELENLAAFVLERPELSTQNGQPGENWLEEPSDDFRAQARQVQEKLQGVVPQWMIPSVFLPLSYMPVMPSGKCDRKKLRSLAAAMSRPQLQSYTADKTPTVKRAPSTPMEKTLQELWANVLFISIDEIGLDDEFTGLGGTSIHAMKLTGMARHKGLKLAIGDVIRHGSLVKMAATLQPMLVETMTAIPPFSLLPTTENRAHLLDRAVRICQVQDERDIEDIYPCTPLQEGVVSLTPRNPQAYTVAFEYKLPADLNLEKFKWAWDSVMDANPILRTRFIQSTTGAMYQVVVRQRLPWESEANVKSASCDPTTWGDWKLGQPMSRFCIRQSKSSASDYTLIFLIHHAISEGWSIPLLLQQVQLAYDKGSSLPSRPFSPFIDYVSRARPSYEAFWTRYFAHLQAAAFPPIPSATYTPRPTGKMSFSIPVESPGMNEFSVPNRLKLAWSILISLYTDNTDTLFGLTVAGRGAPVLGIEDMTGPTIATIPCRLRLQLDGTVADALRKVQDDSIVMVPYEQVGLQHLSGMGQEVARARSAFQSLLVIQPQPDASPDLFRTSRHLASLGDFSTYAITLICQQMTGSVEVDATFDPNIVNEANFGRMLQQMRHIFQQLTLSQGARTVGELNTTSPEDLVQLAAWNSTLPQTVNTCAHDLIQKQSDTHPGAPAVCAWDGGFTYGEVENLSSNFAAYLLAQGVGPEVFVPLCFEKSRWTTIAMLGVLKAGGAFILLDPSNPVKRLREICRIANAPLVVASERNAKLAHKIASRSVVLNTDWKPWESPEAPRPNPKMTATPANSMYAVFSSDLSSVPKGTTHSHISWCTSAQANRISLYLDSTSRVFQVANYATDIGIADNLLTLVAGGCICIPKNEEIRGGNLADAINEFDANWACLTPVSARNLDPEDVPTLKTLGLFGETMTNELISFWSPHVRLLNVYNPAGCAILATLHRNVHDYRDPDNIGFPTSAACWVVDIQNQQRLAPIGTVGLLLVESPIVAKGYLNNPGLTADSFIPSDQYPAWFSKFRPHGTSRLYRTRDLVQYTSDGSLRYVNRLDSQIKLRGQRIELREIEYHLRQTFPEAQEVVVEIVMKKDSEGPALTAFIQPKPQIFRMSDQRFHSLAAEATARIELLLPRYMIPTVFIPVDQLPYSESGKLNRKLLRNLAVGFSLDETTKPVSATKVMPISDEQRVLHDLFARVLKVPAHDLSIEENFVRLGCDSIVTMKLVSMAKDLGLVFNAIDVFQNPTISSLAKVTRRYYNDVDDLIQPLSLLPKDIDLAQLKSDAIGQCGIEEDQIEDIYPCTPLQSGLISISAKNSDMYVGRFGYAIPRETDLTRYQNAWNHVLQMNTALRTRIIQSSDNSFFQVVLKSLPPWEIYGTVDEQEHHSKSYVMGLGVPLICLSLAPSADGSGRHSVLLTMHHSLYDGRSLELLNEQVLQAYNGQQLSPPPFNRFIRHIVQAEGCEDFWISQMNDLNAAQFPALPGFDYTPNPVQFLSHSVTGLPRTRGGQSLTAMVQLAWAVVVSHYTDSNDVVFGLTVDGRSAAVDGVTDIAGPTIATIPLRILLDSEKTVEDFLAELQHKAIAMIPFVQYGLPKIRRLNENTAKACGFQTHLVVQPPSFTSSMGTGEIATLERGLDMDYKAFANYAFVMICHMHEESNDLLVSINYDSEVVDMREARRLVEQFHGVLRQLFEKQRESIQRIEVVSREDMAQLAKWNNPLPPATDDTLHNLVLRHCLTRPDAEAVSSWDGVFTYQQLDDLSARLAQHLLTLGVQAESKVAVCLEKSCWSIVAFLAVLRSGCTCVIVDPGHPRRRIEQILERAGPELMVVSERYAELADSFVGGVVSISPSIGDLPSLTTTLPFVTPRQAAFILFTSGSTGTPKGIVMEHVNLCTSVSYAGVKMNFTSESRCLHFSSYAFDASIYEIFNTLGFGGCLCIISESDRMNNLAAFINSQRTNLVILTPSTATLLQPEDVPTVKTFIAGGEALTHDIVNTWADKVHLINGYGPAESTICCLGRVPSTGWKYGTIGPMVGGVGWIVDRYDHTKLAAVGAIGELVIEGPVVTRGYLDEPEKTAAAYIDTPAWLMNFRSKATSGRLYKSGDLVQYTHDGGIRFVGRMQGQVKLRGQRIELGEVEYHVKKAFPVTSDVVAKIVHPSGEGRKPFLVACVFVNDQTPDNSGDLFHESTSSFLTMAGKAKLEVSGSLPSYMVPEVFLPLRRLPLGATGKLDHRQLQEACSSLSLEQINRYSTEAQVAKRAPSTDIEKTLREVWARVLSIEESAIGVDDNWIRLGGDSLLAMRVVSQASAAGLKTSVEALFQGKTIAKMGLRTEYLHPNQRLVAEPVNTLFELTPMQRLFFDNVGSRYNQFYQSRSFRLSREVSPNTVKSAVRWVVENHSMLRARFVETSRGQWKQMVTNDTDRSYSYRESVVETPEAATALLEADQGDLDIREGPLFICHLLHHSPDKQLDLAFTAHRLVVDDASWKILSSDIDILLEGQQTPPPPSLPVQTWSRLQAEAAKTPQPTRTSNVPEDYWEINLGDNGSEDVIDDGFVLTEQVTQALLGNANDAFRTQPVEILHAAILQAFAHVFSDRAMPTIFTEDHDRDQQGPNSDFSRTVGWLSSMRPVDVSVQPGESFLDIVRRTKDARRNVTNDSWPGFTSSDRDSDDSVASPTSRPIEILFNYHTAYEDNKTSVLRPLARTSGAFDRATHKVTGLSLVDVAAHIRDSQLYICFIYNRQMRHGQSSIRDWINETRRCLESAPAILTVQQPSFTVSDFPLLAYSSSAMEAFNKTVVEPLLVRSLEIEDAFKCSPIQDGMLLSRAKEEGLYMHRFICQVKSSSDSQVQPEKLQAAWQKVMQRHPLLRALLYESPDMDGHYNQVVLKTAPPDMSIILPPSTDPVKELERYQFDMSPLTPQHRLAICASPSGQVQILVEIHHALTDGRSNQLLFHDLSLAYEERLDLTPVRAYRDYVRYIDAHPLYEATAFWEQYLRLVEPCNLLPSPPCPLPNQDKYVRQALQFTLPFGKELRNFCANQGLTLANVFQLAWALVLRVYLNSESACFGYMISGRNLPIADIHDTIGPILNTHICSISIEETESILNLLHKCQADYVESLAHQHISMLDKIKSTGRSASSLFNTIMSVIPALDEDNDKSALIFEHSKDANPTEYDLALHLGVGAHEIIVSWEYVLAFMSHEQIENISDTFQQAILSIMSEPLQAVRDVDLFGPLAKQRVTQYNKKEPPALVQFPDQLIVNQCLAQPMAMSVDAWDGSFTYEQLNKMSDLVAAELRRCGVQPNRTVALCFDKSCWMPVAMLATLKAGGTFVALHASNPIERLREICDDAEISIALTSEQNRELAAQICSQVLVVDEGIIAWENRPPPPEQHVRNVEDIAYLIFTSGSSGKPKGVMVSHRAISTNGIANGHAFMMNASSRVFQFSSYAFDMNLLEQITALMMGACICIPSESQKHDIPKSVATFQANWVAFTPAVARLLNPSDLPTLRTMMVGGELVTEKELEAWRNHVNLFLGYGPTECTITVCSQLVTPEIVDGRTLGHCHGGCGWVVNPKYPDRLVPVGAIGELVIEGPVVATGYLNDPVKTATAFIESPPWLVDLRGKSTGHIYKTGDLVRFTDNGKILYLGRKDLQVKLRGNRIELGEVEARLRLAFPGIKDAVAEIVQPEGGNRQPMLMAFVLMSAAEREEIPDDSQDTLLRNPSSEFSAHAQLAESDLSKYLPVYMIPTVYLPIWYIPLTRNDKVDRKKIREVAARLSPQQLEAYDFSAGSSGTPTTTEEVLLQRVWAQLLNKDVASIGLHTNFFRMGGDSVLAMSMISQARNAGYSIKMADVFNHPKLASLAAALVHKTVANRSEIAPFALLKGKGGDESLINLAATQCGIPASSIEDIYPTTPLQEGLVALAAKQPGKYIVTMKHQLSEGVELEKFVAAWDLTVASNPILRTRVIESDSLGFLQVVVRDAIPWQTVDDEDAYEERISATNMGLGDTLIHFGISQRESGKQPEFYLTMHHAIYDGGSMPLLWKQVHSAYHGESLSPQPFNRFIEHILATEGADAFWKTEFDGLNAAIFPSLPSPVYVPDPSSSLVYTMSSVEHQAVNVTTATAIRLAWALVMACHTDSEDVVHGLTVNGRSAPMEGIEDITGPTFATFPVRTQVRRSDTVTEALASIQDKTVASMPFQQFGTQNIRQLNKDAARACDFQCHLAVQAPRINLANELVSDIGGKSDNYEDFASYALVVVCHLPRPGEHDIEVSVNYDQNIVETQEAMRMMQQFEHVLRQIELSQGNPNSESIKICDIDIISPEDKEQLGAWNSVLPPANDACLHELVLRHAVHSPDAPAISAWDGDMTFKELETASAVLAQHLLSLGLRPKSLVPLLFDRSKWVIVAMTALHRIGAAIVNIDPTHPKERIQDIVSRTEANFILGSPSYRDSMVFEVTTFVSVPIEGLQAEVKDLAYPTVSPRDVAFVIFTSGSTGKPKGILMEHVNIASSIGGYSPRSHFDRNTRGLHFASYAFDASIYEIFGVLINGGCICIPSEYDRLNDVVPFINKHNVTWAIFTPSYLTLLKPESIPSVRTIMLGGEAVTQENVSSWAGKVNLLNGYGPAEATICAVGPLTNHSWKQGTIGHVTGGVGWVVMPSDRSRLAPIGAPGELVIEGAVVTRSYLSDPEKTLAAYATDPVWLRPFRPGHSGSRVYYSGDIVQYNADGTIRYLGRADNQVKLRGQRIELGEVEHHVRSAFPNAIDVAAEVVTPTGGSPMLVAFVANMTESPGSVTRNLFCAPSQEFLTRAGEATEKISRVVPRYMVPAAYIPLSEIPRTSSDKANRRLLREEAMKLSPEEIQAFTRSQATARRQPETEHEKTLQSLWAQVFKVPKDDIGADDNFLNLGDSLAAIRLSNVARSQGLHLPVSQIFNYPILSEQARVVTALEVEYRPGSLLGDASVGAFFNEYLTDKVSSYKARDVEDILPSTEQQRAFVEMRNVSYSRVHLSTRVDPRRLEKACRALIRKHAILRTVFVPHNGQVLQVVLRNPAFQFKEIQCEEQDLTEYANSWRYEDSCSPVPFGSLHFQATLVSRSESDHMLILRLTHAQYDAIAIKVLLNDLAAAYNGARLARRGSSFAQFMDYWWSRDFDELVEFWRGYLHGVEMIGTEMLRSATPKHTEAKFTITRARKILLPRLPDGITMTTLSKAAWAVVLARVTNITDVVFGHVTDGRSIPLADVDVLAGPCAMKTPLRVKIQPEWTILELLNHVWDQESRSANYGSMDFGNIAKNATEWTPGTEFGSVVGYEEGDDTTGWRWETMNVGVESHLQVVTSPAGEGMFRVEFTVSSVKMHPEDVERIMEEFCRVLVRLSGDVERVVPLENKLDADEDCALGSGPNSLEMDGRPGRVWSE